MMRCQTRLRPGSGHAGAAELVCLPATTRWDGPGTLPSHRGWCYRREMAKLGRAWYSWLVLVGIFFQSLNGKCVACVLSNMSVCSDSQFCSSTKQASRQNGHAQLLSTHTTHFYRDVFQFSSVFETGKNIFTKICCYCASLVQVLRLKVPGPVWGWVVSTEHRDQRLPVRSWGRRRTHLQVNSAN